METNPAYLPHELIILILLRLPVMSLIRFKCVCKLWFSLISDPYFANSHFQITAVHSRKILFISNPDLESRSVNFEASLSDDSASTSLNLNFLQPLQRPPRYYLSIKTKCSCRGFIFLHYSSNIYIWNPSTRVYKKIPLSPYGFYFGVNYSHYLYGFGYDELRDDYLVVIMSFDTSLDNISPHLEYFSLRDNTWKEIEGTQFPYYMNAFDYLMVGSFFNGAIHWLGFHLYLSMNVIVVFDLIERELLDMSLPDLEHEPTNCDLWVFGEFLSLWAMGEDIVELEIWVMKEYKVHSSWTKILVLTLDVIPTHYFSPICCTKSGDIIGTDGGNGLVKCDEKGQLLEHCTYRKEVCGVAMYTESLFSLSGDNDQN